MPAMTSLFISRTAPLWRTLAAVGAGLAQLARTVRNRHTARMLGRLDDHMLADIGLTRSDLRDAFAEPLWHDPTDVLARRAAERRGSRRRPTPKRPNDATRKRPNEVTASPPLMPAPHLLRYPSADRKACHLM